MGDIRINKRLAELGLCSRREGDTLIEATQVLVNGIPAVLGQKVSESDTIEIKGTQKERVYYAYYKGRGIITHSPAEGETDIKAKLQEAIIKGSNPLIRDVYPVGRLDKDSEGLIILTNDGRITAPLLAPEAHIEKTYEVTVDKALTGSFLKDIQRGVDIEGYLTKPATAEKKTNKTFRLTLTEGKKHQIRRMCAALGFQVQSLKRIQIANIELGQLKPNQYRKIAGTELQTLFRTLDL